MENEVDSWIPGRMGGRSRGRVDGWGLSGILLMREANFQYQFTTLFDGFWINAWLDMYA